MDRGGVVALDGVVDGDDGTEAEGKGREWAHVAAGRHDGHEAHDGARHRAHRRRLALERLEQKPGHHPHRRRQVRVRRWFAPETHAVPKKIKDVKRGQKRSGCHGQGRGGGDTVARAAMPSLAVRADPPLKPFLQPRALRRPAEDGGAASIIDSKESGSELGLSSKGKGSEGAGRGVIYHPNTRTKGARCR